MKRSQLSFGDYIKNHQTNFNKFLMSSLKKKTDEQDEIIKAARYSLSAGGKRLRPLLAIATAEGLGKGFDDIKTFAVSLEMIHTYSLIHDDLPAMDNDVLRRGKPTCHVVFGEKVAFYAGLYLLESAFMTLIQNASNKNQREAALAIADAAGVNGMIGGQMADMSSTGSKPNTNAMRFIHTRKTGRLIAVSVHAVALWFGIDKNVHKILLKIGDKIGLAFQIVDDILDVEQTSRVLGKTTGKDSQQGKMTYPALFGIKESRVRVKRLYDEVERLLGTIEGFYFNRLFELSGYIINRIN